jgi:hypothetical protein
LCWQFSRILQGGASIALDVALAVARERQQTIEGLQDKLASSQHRCQQLEVQLAQQQAAAQAKEEQQQLDIAALQAVNTALGARLDEVTAMNQQVMQAHTSLQIEAAQALASLQAEAAQAYVAKQQFEEAYVQKAAQLDWYIQQASADVYALQWQTQQLQGEKADWVACAGALWTVGSELLSSRRCRSSIMIELLLRPHDGDLASTIRSYILADLLGAGDSQGSSGISSLKLLAQHSGTATAAHQLVSLEPRTPGQSQDCSGAHPSTFSSRSSLEPLGSQQLLCS